MLIYSIGGQDLVPTNTLSPGIYCVSSGPIMHQPLYSQQKSLVTHPVDVCVMRLFLLLQAHSVSFGVFLRAQPLSGCEEKEAEFHLTSFRHLQYRSHHLT